MFINDQFQIIFSNESNINQYSWSSLPITNLKENQIALINNIGGTSGLWVGKVVNNNWEILPILQNELNYISANPMPPISGTIIETSATYYNYVYNAFAEKPRATSPVYRDAGQYVISVRNPLYGITNATRARIRLSNHTSASYQVGRVWSSTIGVWSANLAAGAKKNIGTSSASNWVETTWTNSVCPSGTKTSPGLIEAWANHPCGGTSGTGGVLFRFEVSAGNREERYPTVASGFVQASSLWTSSTSDPTSTETVTWTSFTGIPVLDVMFEVDTPVTTIGLFGDSHFEGFITSDEMCSWSYLAQDRLREQGYKINLANYGWSGEQTSASILRAKDSIQNRKDKWTAILQQPFSVNNLSDTSAVTTLTTESKNLAISQITDFSSYISATSAISLYADVVYEPNVFNTSAESLMLREIWASCGEKIYLDGLSALVYSSAVDPMLPISGTLRPDNLHLTAPTNSITVAQNRPAILTSGADIYAAKFAETFPQFLIRNKIDKFN